MTDPTPPPTETTAAASPGERRLAHPPSDRYRDIEIEAEAAGLPDPAASVPRGLAVSLVIGIVGAAAIVFLGGVLAVTFGLLVIAGTTGLAVSQGLRVGAREHLSARRRTGLAVGFALGAVALGQLGLWLYARTEGGVLAPLDYLWEVYGILVPLEFAAAAAAAWLSAR
jgi:hypothetical protein